jgi:hypothetical protein
MQTSVQTSMDIGLPGQIADLANSQVLTYANNSKKLDLVEITAADTTTTVTINGTAFTVTTDGSDTKAELAAAVVALINAGSEPVTTYYTAAAESFQVESDTPGTTTTVVGTANCTVTAQIGNAAAIGFGYFVCQDAQDVNKARSPIAAADITDAGDALGITVHTQAVAQNLTSTGSSGSDGYALGEAMSVMRKGRIYVQVEDAVVAGNAVYVRYVAGTGETLGAFRSDADTSDAAILPGAKYRTSAAASGIAIVEINLP